MASPFFYFAHLATMADEFVLNENSSRHIVQVLRMQPGENLRLTNGKGLSAVAVIRDANKKHCGVNIIRKKNTGISETKNTNWSFPVEKYESFRMVS